MHINIERDSSKTSFLQQWEKPNSVAAEYSKGENVGEIFKHKSEKRPIYCVSESENKEALCKTELYEQIKNIDCPFSKILKAECENESAIISTSIVKQIVDSAVELGERGLLFQCLYQLDNQKFHKLFRCYEVNYLSSSGKISLVQKDYERVLTSIQLNFYCDNVKITNSQKHKIAIETRTQYRCSEWFQQRKLRISASQSVHKIMTRHSGDYDTLALTFTGSKDINSPAVRYGRDNEQTALKEFCLTYKCCVRQLGLFVKEQQPWLCCSPDGIVLGQDCLTLLEIKCPYSCREKPVIEEQICNVPYLYVTSDGGVTLKDTHVYYTQVQVSMYILNLVSCDLFIYSPKGSVKVNISINEEFLSNIIPKVEKFYFEHYLPLICKQAVT